MGTRKGNKKSGFWNMLDNLEGDKVIWTIVFLLIMISILTISSSTSLLAIHENSSRISYALEQVGVAALGMLIIVGCYWIGKIGVFWIFSRYGFLLSFCMLAFLALHIKLPGIEAVRINDAWRCIRVFGFQLHVFEFVKVFMVMYIAWAMEAIRSGKTPLAKKLSRQVTFFGTEHGKTWLYVLGPIILTTVMIAMGSNSSAMFIGLIMIATALVGGLKWKYFMRLAAAGAALVLLIFGAYKIAGGESIQSGPFNRIGLIEKRLKLSSQDPLKRLHQEKPGSLEFQKVLDETMQPMSAKVAVSEGGLFGKGPGKSTQRYVVAVMYEDYMFSFIVEEYGLIGAILVMMLYGSLLARGSIIVRNCSNLYARTMIAGLVIMITGQAMMHMFINVDLGPLTGQTLPMISHGNSSFLAFSLAFGIILSVSKMAKKKIEQETAEVMEQPLIVTGGETPAGDKEDNGE